MFTFLEGRGSGALKAMQQLIRRACSISPSYFRFNNHSVPVARLKLRRQRLMLLSEGDKLKEFVFEKKVYSQISSKHFVQQNTPLVWAQSSKVYCLQWHY